MGKSKKLKKSKESREKDELLTPHEELRNLISKIQKIGEKVSFIQEKIEREEVKKKSDEVLPPTRNELAVNSSGDAARNGEITAEDESYMHDAEDRAVQEAVLVEPGSSATLTGENLEKEMEEEREWLEIIGDDPTESSSLQVSVKPELVKVWKFYCREGMKKEIEEALLAKYACVSDFQAPKLNPQILATLEKQRRNGKKRDAYMVKIQKISGLSWSILGSFITNIYEHRNEGLDVVEIIKRLKDIGHLLSLQMYKQFRN